MTTCLDGWKTLVDQQVSRDPENLGYGYDCTQHAWQYDPAIEQRRKPFFEFLAFIQEKKIGGTFLQVGLGKRGGSHFALSLLAERMITIEIDAERVRHYRQWNDLDAQKDILIEADSQDPLTRDRLRSLVESVDLLFLDGEGTYEGMRADWEFYAPLVRAGGMIAICDRSQSLVELPRATGVDRFVFQLERLHLQPQGMQLMRFGQDKAIHCYLSRGPDAHRDPRLPEREVTAVMAVPVELGSHLGYKLSGWQGRAYAFREAQGRLDPQRLARHEYNIVLVAEDQASLVRRVEAYESVQPLLEKARDLLAADQPDEALRIGEEIQRRFRDLRQLLIPSLEAEPFSRELLLTLGSLCIFQGQLQEGVALLEKSLEQGLDDTDLLHTLLKARLHLLEDPDGARGFLDSCKRRARDLRRSELCRGELQDHPLWRFPQLLEAVEGVVQIGTHGGQEVEAFSRLEIQSQAYIEGDPQTLARLEAVCASMPEDGMQRCIHPTLLAHSPDTRTLFTACPNGKSSLLELHPLTASHYPQSIPRSQIDVRVETLDELVRQGRLDPSLYQLLVIDTQGNELEVLQGASQTLGAFQIVCVALYRQPIYRDVALPEEIVSFLAEVNEYGFSLRAYEEDPDGIRIHALFSQRRVKRKKR